MAQKIFDKEFIFNRIRDSKFLFWSLALVEGFKNLSNVMQYYGNDFDENDTEETKIEKSINKLDSVIKSFTQPDCIFQIEIKASKQANGSGIIGPFQFYNFKEEKTEQLNGVFNVPRGYIHESMLKGIEERIKNDFEIRLENYKIETEKERQKEEYNRKMSELEEREKRLKELERGYNSNVAKTADVLVEAGKKIITYFINANTNTPIQQPKTPAALGQAPEPEQDEKTKALDNLAEYLYNNFDINTINNLYKNLQTAKTKSNATNIQNENCSVSE